MKVCAWCEGRVSARRRDAVFCSKRCRQTAFRLRRRFGRASATSAPGRFGYADPPYPGLARRYYRREESYAGEVDHEQLIGQLERGGYTGWALSTSERALRTVLPLCPAGARVCPIVKPTPGYAKRTAGLHNCWEALIVVGGRQTPPGGPDWLAWLPTRGGGDLMGRKNGVFCAFLFGALGMAPGDELDDLFPGTGIVARAWRYLSVQGGSPEKMRELVDDLVRNEHALPPWRPEGRRADSA